MVTVGIVGVSGYGGGELARLLARHPHVSVTFVVSETYAGKPLAKSFRGLEKTAVGSLTCQRWDDVRESLPADVLFLAQENGKAMKQADAFLAQGKRIIDLSADFRLKNLADFETWYKMPHVAQELVADGTAVYGLVELYRDRIPDARLIANPGCYPTATLLALAPLLKAGLISPDGIVVDAKSGVSGAGRSKPDLDFRYSEANESVKAYGVGGVHRHTPEIEQGLSDASNSPVQAVFTPHLIPMTRGILSTCYAKRINADLTTEQVLETLNEFYADSPFVVVRDENDQPATKDVYGSNYCHLTAKVDSRTGTVILTSVIDNLVKGAAGQAVQNLNLMMGLPETAGLEGTGIWP